MSIRKVGGIGTRKNGTGGFTANLGEGAKFITINVYCDDGHSANYTINKGDALCLENAGTSAAHLTIGGVATNVIELFGFGNVARPVDHGSEVSTSNGFGGAIGGAVDLALCFGIAAETVTIEPDTFTTISAQVWGKCEDVKVNSSITIGQKLFVDTGGTTAAVGRLDDANALVGGTAQGDIEEGIEAAAVGIALTAESGNKCDVWLLDPLQLAN